MGWLWNDKPESSNDDPYSKLDPTLREYLNKESPLKLQDAQPKQPAPASVPSPDAASNQYRSQLGWTKPGLDQNHQNALPVEDKPAVPPESLYQDGRYAHLWKDYRPQAEIENASRSDQDRLADVIDAYNDRKAAISRAAMENCIVEQLDQRDCWENGGVSDRMTMCRKQNRIFFRCYEMQSRFMKALGYLSTMRTEEEEEKIQMHADKLYHEMLAREEEAETAKKEGREVGALPPLISSESATKALGENSAWARARQKALESGETNRLSAYTPQRQEQIKQQIAGLGEREKELELQLLAAESRAQVEYAEKIREQLDVEREHRRDRRERGKETVGDTIKRLWGWDQ